MPDIMGRIGRAGHFPILVNSDYRQSEMISSSTAIAAGIGLKGSDVSCEWFHHINPSNRR
eukprot:262477-Amphidinium_carterae.1